MKRTILIIFSVLLLTTALVGCAFNVNRNDDGTLRVETNLPIELVRTVIENAANFSNVVNLQLEAKEGYILVTADEIEVQGITARDVSLHLELGASSGQMTAEITNVQVADNTFDDETFEPYNQMIAARLQEASQQYERASVDSVTVSPEGILVVWRVDASLKK